MPASTSAARARSASSSRMKKSTSCSVGGPPRAQPARPPPSRYGISASRSAAAATFIASTSCSKLGDSSGTSGRIPARADCESWVAGYWPTMSERIRVAAAGDIHCSEPLRERITHAFAAVAEEADLILLAGDLTTHGEPEQAAVLADACWGLSVPVDAVLGNHDFHANRCDEIVTMLEEAGIRVLQRSTAIH